MQTEVAQVCPACMPLAKENNNTGWMIATYRISLLVARGFLIPRFFPPIFYGFFRFDYATKSGDRP